MAEILSKNLKVKNGQILTVSNTKRKEFGNEAKTYKVLWVADDELEYEFCIMLTEKELTNCERAIGTFAEEYVIGHLYTHFCVKCEKNYKKYFIKVLFENGDESCLILTPKKLDKFRKRAEKNIEDCPEKSWWTDLTD